MVKRTRLRVHHVGDTGFGKKNDSPATSTVILFAETSPSVILETLKCVVTHHGEGVRERGWRRLKAWSLSFQTTPSSAFEALTISRYGVFEATSMNH